MAGTGDQEYVKEKRETEKEAREKEWDIETLWTFSDVHIDWSFQ